MCCGCSTVPFNDDIRSGAVLVHCEVNELKEENVGKFAAFGKDRALNKMRERGGRRLVSVGENCVISSLCVVTSVKWCSLSCC